MVIVLYVDDLLIRENCQNQMAKIQLDIKAKMKVRSGCRKSIFLGLVIEEVEGGICFHKRSAAQKRLRHFDMDICRLQDIPIYGRLWVTTLSRSTTHKVKSYRELVWCLMNLNNTTNPFIAFATSFLSRFSQKPLKNHWTEAKHVLRYL